MQSKILEIIIKAKDDATQVLKSLDAQVLKNKQSMDAIKQASILAFGTLTAVLGNSVKDAVESENAISQLNAVLASTGGVAGVTSQSAVDLASSLQLVTTYTDEAILGGENMLLTFTNIGQNIFPQATQTILDMSTALGQDLQSSAIQLGKALNDPIQGVTALQRVGVNFSDSQKKVIENLVKTGNALEAQKLILQELNKEFGGSAEAAAKTFGGQIIVLKNQLGEVSEAIGKTLIGALTQLNSDGQATTRGIEALTQATRPLQVVTYAGFQGVVILAKGLNVLGIAISAGIQAGSDLIKSLGNVATALGKIKSGDFSGFGDLFKVPDSTAFDSIKGKFTDAFNSLLDSADNLKNSGGNVDQIMKNLSNTLSNVKGPASGATKSTTQLTDAQKKQIEVLAKLKDKYSDFSYSVQNDLDDLKTKHDSSISDITAKIKDLRQSLADLQGDYDRQKSDDTASIADKIVGTETDLANARIALANTTSFDQIKAYTDEINEKQKALQDSAGFQSTIQGAIDEARRRASESDLERAIEDYNSKRVLAQQEFDAKQAEINAQIDQLSKQKLQENLIYQQQTTLITQLFDTQKQHYEDTLTQRYAFTQEYLDKELALYQQLERQIDQVIAKKQQAGVTAGVAGFRASGGDVQVGSSYVVGERGPEIFTPATNGSIMPNDKLSANGRGNIVVNINGGTYLSRDVAKQIGDEIISQFKQVQRI